MKQSFAQVAEQLAKKQKKYEDMLSSNDYRERNTAQLMLQRIQQRLNELKELQEEIKAKKAIKTNRTKEYFREGLPKMFLGGSTYDSPRISQEVYKIINDKLKMGEIQNAAPIKMEPLNFSGFETTDSDIKLKVPSKMKSIVPSTNLKVNTEKRSVTPALNHNPNTVDNILSGTDKALGWVGENAVPIASLANTIGGFIANNKAINDMEAPMQPVLTPSVSLNKTLDTSKEYSEINRGYNYGLEQSEQLGSTQAELASKLGFTSARNRSISNLESKASNYRSQINNQEAGINAQINSSNAQITNNYLAQKNDFYNQKAQAKASNVNNLLGNIASTVYDLGANKADLGKYGLALAGLDADAQKKMLDLLADGILNDSEMEKLRKTFQ